MNKLDVRRKKISKVLNWVFWITLITGVVVIPFFKLQMTAPQFFKVMRLIHLILGIAMTVLVVMHLRLEKRWESLRGSGRSEGKDELR